MKKKRRIEITVFRRRVAVVGGGDGESPSAGTCLPRIDGGSGDCFLARVTELRICDGQLTRPEYLPQCEPAAVLTEAAMQERDDGAPRRLPFNLRRFWRRRPAATNESGACDEN